MIIGKNLIKIFDIDYDDILYRATKKKIGIDISEDIFMLVGKELIKDVHGSIRMSLYRGVGDSLYNDLDFRK